MPNGNSTRELDGSGSQIFLPYERARLAPIVALASTSFANNPAFSYLAVVLVSA
jgi:hypothetical protein